MSRPERLAHNLPVVALLLWLLMTAMLPVHGAHAQQGESCEGQDLHVSVPLTDLGADLYVRMDGQETGVRGGLYSGGSNRRPPRHEAAGIQMARQITPLNAAGSPDPTGGKIVMISVGMSNAEQEFNRFIDVLRQDSQVNPSLMLINGAQGGQVAEDWVDPAAPTWTEVDRRLAARGVTPAQVQVAWVKQTQVQGGDFPAKAIALQAELEAIVRNLKTRYPNVRIAYLSSRTRSLTYWNGLSPEPVAFETAFAVKWMIMKQILGDPTLNYNPARGEVLAPYLSWGPYLWIDGSRPRQDGQIWEAADLTGDCTHPSSSGADKVAAMMVDFFKNDRTAVGWFRYTSTPPPRATATVPAVSPTANPTATVSVGTPAAEPGAGSSVAHPAVRHMGFSPAAGSRATAALEDDAGPLLPILLASFLAVAGLAYRRRR